MKEATLNSPGKRERSHLRRERERGDASSPSPTVQHQQGSDAGCRGETPAALPQPGWSGAFTERKEGDESRDFSPKSISVRADGSEKKFGPLLFYCLGPLLIYFVGPL